VIDFLLPYQQRWNDDLARVKVCEKSRQIGITWATAADAVLNAGSMDGSDWWYSGYNQDQSKEFIRDVAYWIKVFSAIAEIGEEIVDDEGKQILVESVRFNSGHRITALPSSPRILRSRRGIFVLDEYAFHDYARELRKAAIAGVQWGGRVIVISTHNGLDSEFNQLLEEIKTGKHDYSHHKIAFDDAIRDGLCRRICQVRGIEWSPEYEQNWRAGIVKDYGFAADEELFCIPTGAGGTYLSRAMIERCMVDDGQIIRLTLPDSFLREPEKNKREHIDQWCDTHLALPLKRIDPNVRTGIGVDFGRSSDMTALAPIVIGQDLDRKCPFIVELRNVPFREQEQITFYLMDRLPRMLAGKFDATGNGQALAEAAVLRYGEHRIEAIHLTDKRYAELLPPLRAAFEDHRIWIPRDADVMSDLRQFQVINGIPKLPKYRTAGRVTGEQRHGDTAIAIALAYDATRADTPEISYQPIARNAGMWGAASFANSRGGAL
jgi:phage FluMu gp28-like protein